jgi:hypothetical protein
MVGLCSLEPFLNPGGSYTLGTPQLWNKLNMHVLPHDNLTVNAELTKQYLDRSRYLPLNHSLVYGTPIYQAELESTPLIALFKMPQNFAPRWHKLVLGMSATLYTTFLGEVTYVPTLNTLQ